ncbi:hypothetical protein S7335_1240 [Synechococcus sp. PCC 7335]|nr:hypothetical protein [Synechococcus sp. PCC 7335]EDX82470.1 hypothetical protein S7335_1174 [Synechococcus sp. PCC 7335]EDX82536.1 hypothetical protein S7335_1240 [Synechococcus sp. PCC 7335]
MDQVEKWLCEYHAEMQAEKLQEQVEFEAALAELDAEIPRQ